MDPVASGGRPPHPDDLLTRSQVAAAFGVHRDTVSRWHRQGLLPPVAVRTLGGHRRWRRAQVDAFAQLAGEV